MNRKQSKLSTSFGFYGLTADTKHGKVTFGLLGKRAWVMVEREDGESYCSLDTKRAARLASNWLDKDLWPQFAVHLHPDNQVPDAQPKLFS